MSAQPPFELIRVPQMMSLGFRLANLALAETPEEVRVAADKLHSLIGEIASVLPPVSNGLEATVSIAEPAELRALLNSSLLLEQELSELCESILGKTRSRNLPGAVGQPEATALRDAANEVAEGLIPLMRDLRLRLICAIAERGRAAGLSVFECSDEFRRRFRVAPLAETESWQETAYILANIDAAKRLSNSVRSASIDRTEQISSAAADAPFA